MTRPKEELKFPRRGQAGSGELIWERLRLSAALDTLHNPRYAGAFCFGKTRSWKDPQGGRHCVDLPREQWAILIKEAHPGYISWEEFEENQKRLQLNQQTRGLGRHSGPAREGPALLQGLVVCGKCGRSMTLRYHEHGGRLSPDYLCQQQRIDEYKKQRESAQQTITQEQNAQILALAEDFPRLWKDPGATDRDRERMA